MNYILIQIIIGCISHCLMFYSAQILVFLTTIYKEYIHSKATCICTCYTLTVWLLYNVDKA